MTTTHPAYEAQDFATPSETRTFPNGRLDLLRIGGAEIGRLTLEPGWRYDYGSGHVRGVDVFTVRDGLVAAKLSYVKG